MQDGQRYTDPHGSNFLSTIAILRTTTYEPIAMSVVNKATEMVAVDDDCKHEHDNDSGGDMNLYERQARTRVEMPKDVHVHVLLSSSDVDDTDSDYVDSMDEDEDDADYSQDDDGATEGDDDGATEGDDARDDSHVIAREDTAHQYMGSKHVLSPASHVIDDHIVHAEATTKGTRQPIKKRTNKQVQTSAIIAEQPEASHIDVSKRIDAETHRGYFVNVECVPTTYKKLHPSALCDTLPRSSQSYQSSIARLRGACRIAYARGHFRDGIQVACAAYPVDSMPAAHFATHHCDGAVTCRDTDLPHEDSAAFQKIEELLQHLQSTEQISALWDVPWKHFHGKKDPIRFLFDIQCRVPVLRNAIKHILHPVDRHIIFVVDRVSSEGRAFVAAMNTMFATTDPTDPRYKCRLRLELISEAALRVNFWHARAVMPHAVVPTQVVEQFCVDHGIHAHRLPRIGDNDFMGGIICGALPGEYVAIGRDSGIYHTDTIYRRCVSHHDIPSTPWVAYKPTEAQKITTLTTQLSEWRLANRGTPLRTAELTPARPPKKK
jgi:DNA-directed RNA polymerase subunit H (RpoH/RPB5)